MYTVFFQREMCPYMAALLPCDVGTHSVYWSVCCVCKNYVLQHTPLASFPLPPPLSLPLLSLPFSVSVLFSAVRDSLYLYGGTDKEGATSCAQGVFQFNIG